MADVQISLVEKITEFNDQSEKTIYIHQFKVSAKFSGWAPCSCHIKASNPSMINLKTCPKYDTYKNYSTTQRDAMANPLLTNMNKMDAEKTKKDVIEAFGLGLASIKTFCKNTGIEKLTVNEIIDVLNIKDGDTTNRRERNQKVIEALKQKGLLK